MDHSPSSSAEIKNAWHYTSTLSYALIMWCLIKYKNKFLLCTKCESRNIATALNLWSSWNKRTKCLGM
jgi:hypothetical protein